MPSFAKIYSVFDYLVTHHTLDVETLCKLWARCGYSKFTNNCRIDVKVIRWIKNSAPRNHLESDFRI